jgi:hypothetical protein
MQGFFIACALTQTTMMRTSKRYDGYRELARMRSQRRTGVENDLGVAG